MPSSPSARLLCLGMLAIAGCGYTTRGLYLDNVRTVAVPIFKNNGLRRGIEFQLTEKVIQYIEARTPYKVVAAEKADAIIKGEIISFFKNPNGEDGFDNPRGGIMYLGLNVTWIDNRTGQVINHNQATISLQDSAPYNIDTAQSQATATNNLVEQMADQVVTMLQSPW